MQAPPTRSGAILSALALLLAMLAGCAAHEAHVEGRAALERGDRHAALMHYRRAAQLDPRDDDYRRQVRELEQRFTEDFIAAAGEELERRDLRAALGRIDEGLRIVPESQPLQAARQRIEQSMQAAEAERRRALEAARLRRWREARVHMREALKRDPGLINGQADLTRIEREASLDCAANAANSLNEGELDAAEDWARQALEFGHADDEARTILHEAEARREAADLRMHAAAAMQAGRHEEALELLERSEQLHANQRGLSKAIKETRTLLGRKHLAAAERALHGRDTHTALAELQRSRDLLPDFGQVQLRIAALRKGLAEKHAEKVEQALDADSPGRAMLHAACARQYDLNVETPDLLQPGRLLAQQARFALEDDATGQRLGRRALEAAEDGRPREAIETAVVYVSMDPKPTDEAVWELIERPFARDVRLIDLRAALRGIFADLRQRDESLRVDASPTPARPTPQPAPEPQQTSPTGEPPAVDLDQLLP